MAGWADLVYTDEQGVIIAVGPDLFYFLGVAACCAFVPKFVSGARKEPRVASFERFLIAFFIHIGEHENFAILVV